MKSILVLLFTLLPVLSFSQIIVLNPQFGKKDPITIKKGDVINVIVRDTINIATDNFKIKTRRYRGRIAEIENGELTIKYGLFKMKVLDIDHITKIKKIPSIEIWGFLPVAAAVIVVHKNATDQLYFPSVLTSLAGASIIYRLTIEMIINRPKRTAPDLWKKRNRWNLEVVSNY